MVLKMSDSLTVPDGWRSATLGSLGTYVNGRAFKSSEWSKTGRPIIRIQDLTGSNRNPNYFEGEAQERHIVRSGDFLISWSATLGAFIWEGPEAVLNQHIFKVESKIDKRFHYHLVRHELAELGRNAHGSGMVHVTKGIFDATPVAVPESQELQERIAKIIDRADILQESASSHLSAARSGLGRFRLSSLAAAFREANEECLSDEDLVPLERLLREPLKNGYSAVPVNVETPYRVLTLTATTSGQFDGRFFKYTDKTFPKDSPFWLMPGDVVIQRGNTSEYVGVPAIYEGPPGEYIYPDLMIRARPRDDIDPRYLWYMLLAPQSRNFLRERATGSAGNMPKINQKILNSIPIPLPPEEIRKAIVTKLDLALSATAAALERIHLGAGQLSQTSQAVLSKAFSGGLTPSNL